MTASLTRLGTSLALLVAVAADAAEPGPAPERLEVSVEGVEGEVRDNVLGLLAIEQRREDKKLTEAQIERLHADAPNQIRTALEPYGHYRPRIDAALERDEDGTWHAAYRIEPGPAVRVAQLEVTLIGAGAHDRRLREVIATLPLAEGEPFHHEDYRKARRDLQRAAAERGYLDAELGAHRARVDLQAYEARVQLQLVTGPRYRLGPVTFEGAALNDAFLQRFVPFERGDPYTGANLLDLQNALSDSGYFQRVDVEPQREHAEDRHVPVHVRLEPRKRHKFTAGVGFGTDTGPRARIGLERRRLNQWGHRYSGDLRTSDIEQSATVRYTVPLKRPATDSLNYRLGWIRETLETSTSETRLAGVSRNRARGRHWKEQQSLTYRIDDFEIADVSRQSTLLMPAVSWTRTKADNLVYPRHGSRATLTLRGAHEAVISDTSFAQAHLQGKWVRGLWRTGRVLLRGEVGATAVDDFAELPPAVRFFAGGDRSVRGYGFETLGPTDDDGEVIGGRHLLVGSVELEQQILDRWSVAVFYDIGNAVDDFGEPLERGVGVGLRWRSPVGPVRLDLAAGLDRPGDPIRVHIVIGPDL